MFRHVVLLKKAALAMIIGLLIPFASAYSDVQEDYSLAYTQGAGFAQDSADPAIAVAVGQQGIQYDESGDPTLGLGIYWLGQVSGVAGAVNIPIGSFLLFVKAFDINWVTVNWTG